MSFVNVHYDYRENCIYLWEEIKGQRFFDKIEWTPYVFVPDKNGDILTIDGKKVSKKTFSTYRYYYEFCKNNENIYENKVKPEIQFLAERYHGIPDDELEIPKLLTYTLDIEVDPTNGFPNISKANEKIVLVSLMDSINKKIISFGLKDYTPRNININSKEIIYKKCNSEEELLKRLFNFMFKRPPDIITGWNISGFDLPYIINRCKLLFGEKTQEYFKMSPVKIVRTWESKSGYNEMNIDIAGIHILDYMDVYKWYSPTKLERYSLDFVSKHELGEGKLEHKEFKTLYKNWDDFVDYNAIDCKRVDQLEDKKGYIRLIQALSLLTKCPMKFYQAMTQLIEGALITHYRRNGLCAPYFSGGIQEHFPAAYVKEPQKGMFEWVIDIDIASSYPSHIITLNMSTETYFGRIMALPRSQVVEYVRQRNFPSFQMLKGEEIIQFKDDSLKKFNMALKKGLFAIAPCGSVFKTSKEGTIAHVERTIFYKRKEVKGRMKEFERKAKDTKGKEKQLYKDRAKELFSLQWAIKILLNAVFGITSVPYSRYFNVNIAEAITSCGQWTIRQGEKFVNEWFKNYADLDEDFVCYIDTDSLFIRLGDYFKGMEDWENGDDAKKIEIILSFSEQLEKHVNKRTFEETQLQDYNSQVHDFKIMFEQEIVAKTALFVKKKKYSYWIIHKEGIPTDKLQVKGLEIVRSDSAEAVRIKLKNIYEMIMKNEPEDNIVKKIQQYTEELKTVPPEEIAGNITVNNTSKYIDDEGMFEKGTPWHVKGTANYRTLLKELDLIGKYEDIQEGTKGKVVYVKPNRFNFDVLTFNHWPDEFNQYFVVDYEKMIRKFFLKKIGFLLNPMGKDHLLDMKKSTMTMKLFFG